MTSGAAGAVSSTPRRRSVAQRRVPHQRRSQQRVREILDVTARLMEQVGLDNFTTNLLAAELGISVGTLYHYFPNKQAILHAMGVEWLEEWQAAFDEIARAGARGTKLDAFIEYAVDRMLRVYRDQRGVLHLVRTMFIIPELQALDARGDELAVKRLSSLFEQLGIRGDARERARKARIVLKLFNSLLPEAVGLRGAAQRRTLEDLKSLIACTLSARNGTSARTAQ